MKRFFLICLTLAAIVNARPSLQVDKERIEAGQTFNLQLIVPIQELPHNRGIPQMESTSGFSLLGIDSTDRIIRPSMEDMFNSFFGGGHSSYKARIYLFKLRAPKKTGNLNIGQITWEIDGENQIISKSIPVNVQRSFNDDALSVSLTASKKNIYEGEQFYVTLGLHTFEHFEGGLQATDMSTGNDFIIHRSDLNNMEFKPVDASHREMQASAKFAWLSPTKSGKLQIPPFKFKYTKRGEPKVVEEKKQMGGMSFSSRTIKQESIEAESNSPAININVKPLPTENKPENFSGMVGDYKFNAHFDKTNLKVGEALTLSINIKGDGIPGTITDPKLPDFSDFRSVPPENNISKKIVGNKVITTKDIRVFLYPKKKGTFNIPEINYSWFNPNKKKYETTTIGPWVIEVEKGENNAESNFQPSINTTPQGPQMVAKKEIESLGSDIRHIHAIKSTKQSKELYKNLIFWIIFIFAIPFYFITSFIITNHRKKNSDVALLRKGKAHKKLKEQFHNARTALQKNDGKAFYASLENGLIDYLSNLTNQEFKGMTRVQMKNNLIKLNINDITISAIDNWLEKCAFARFAPVTTDSQEQEKMLKDVEKLCEELEKLK